MSEILYLLEMMNGAEGISDIEGKATRVGASERGQRTSFNDLASSHGDHEDDRGVNARTQRRPMPVCPAERSSQPGEKRQGRDRVDCRKERSEVFADFDQERGHALNVLSEGQICFHFISHPSYLLLLVWPYTNGGRGRGKCSGGLVAVPLNETQSRE